MEQMSRRTTTMNIYIYIYMIELEVNIQKHSVKVKVSDFNFSCLQKLKAKKKNFCMVYMQEFVWRYRSFKNLSTRTSI